MTDEPDDSSDLFDGVEESGNDDRPPWRPRSPLGDIANIIAWGAIQSHYEEPYFEPEDRPRGILSSTDREYLYGLKEYAHDQSEANRKQDIRERVEHSLKDFKLLWLLLDTDEREQIFADMGKEAVDESIESMITFAYLGLEQELPRLEEHIERGILAGENARIEERSSGRATNVDVSINIDYDPDVKELYNRLEQGKADQLTPEEIGVLAKAGKLTPDDLKKLKSTETDFPGVYAGDEEP